MLPNAEGIVPSMVSQCDKVSTSNADIFDHSSGIVPEKRLASRSRRAFAAMKIWREQSVTVFA